METEKALKLIEDTDSDQDIKNSTYKGLQILLKYIEELEFAAAHDQIWVCDFEATVTKMSEEEVKNMALYGFFESEDSWAFFT